MNSMDLYRAIGTLDEDILEQSETITVKNENLLEWGEATVAMDEEILDPSEDTGTHRGNLLRIFTYAMVSCLGFIMGNILFSTHFYRYTLPKSSYVTDYICSSVNILPQTGTFHADTEQFDFFFYQDRFYVPYERIYDNGDLIGEHLGTVPDSNDKTTLRSDKSVPKKRSDAKIFCGDLYAVKGYDPAFILCMKQSTGTVCIYICSYGNTFEYGSELYEDQFHLSDNLESIQYESHTSWYHRQNERYHLDHVNETLLDFIKALDAGQFIPFDSAASDKEQNNIAGTEELYHLLFQMNNGMTIHLRLYENGYVKFQGIRNLYIQVPEESYHALLELLDSHIDATAVKTSVFDAPPLENRWNAPFLSPYLKNQILE